MVYLGFGARGLLVQHAILVDVMIVCCECSFSGCGLTPSQLRAIAALLPKCPSVKSLAIDFNHATGKSWCKVAPSHDVKVMLCCAQMQQRASLMMLKVPLLCVR